MRSLPVIDKDTNRVETVAFACLGLVSLVLITVAALNGGKFAAGREDIVASLMKRPSAATDVVRSSTRLPASNGNSSSRSGLAAPEQ